MKLKLRLVTNKPIPIDLDFRKYDNQTVSNMQAIEHTEQIIEFELPALAKGFNRDHLYILKVKTAIQSVIRKQYPNITSIEGLEELKLLKE